MDDKDRYVDRLRAYSDKLMVQREGLPLYQTQQRMVLNLTSILMVHMAFAMEGNEPPPPLDVQNVL